jgi:hypothetical protein
MVPGIVAQTVILATWEAEIRRITNQGRPSKKKLMRSPINQQHKPVIPALWKAEIVRITVPGHSRQKVHKSEKAVSGGMNLSSQLQGGSIK